MKYGPTRRCGGFSLTEMMVVIAMIALMAALLFPALDKARGNAQASYDLNNCRQTALAADMYASDNSDYLPDPGWGVSVPCWASGARIPLGGNPPTFETYTNYVARQWAYYSRGQLYPYLKDQKLTLCPKDNVLNRSMFSRNVYISSYVWNGAVIGYPTVRNPDPYPATFKIWRFQPDAVLQWETDETKPFCFNDFANFPDEGLTHRHVEGGVVGLFGGGAERISSEKFIAMAGGSAPDLAHAGTGWAHVNLKASNRLWCSPENGGRPVSVP